MAGGLLALSGVALSQGLNIRIDPPRFDPPRIDIPIPTPRAVFDEFERRRREAETVVQSLVDKGKEGLDRIGHDASESARQVAEQTKRELEQAGRDASQALRNLAENGKKAVEDTYRNLAKSANDLVDATKVAARFVEREISGYGETLSVAEKRVREGKIVDAVWHVYTDTLNNTSDHAAEAANENELLGQAMQGAATFYGGPAGSAAYAAWLTYKRTGNADLALRIGITSGAQSYVSSSAGGMPAGSAGQLAKKALVTGAAGGIAVAAAGGDDAAVRDAFVKQGGMVMMQGGKSYITKKFDSAAAQVDSFCTSATGTSCKPLLNAVQRDSRGNIIFDDRGLPKVDGSRLLAGRADLGNWVDTTSIPKVSKNLPGIASSLSVLKSEWAISWDPEALRSKSVNAPAVSLTYIGPASPYARKVEELSAAIGQPQARQPSEPVPVEATPEFWVALGDVGTSESFFRRMFVRSRDSLSVGDIVVAQRDVNARPRPAAFGVNPYVLPRGALIVIGEIKEMPTRYGPQRWARLDLDAK